MQDAAADSNCYRRSHITVARYSSVSYFRKLECLFGAMKFDSLTLAQFCVLLAGSREKENLLTMFDHIRNQLRARASCAIREDSCL